MTSGAATTDGLLEGWILGAADATGDGETLAGWMAGAAVPTGAGEMLGTGLAGGGGAVGLGATGGAQATIANVRLASNRLIHLT